MHSDLDALGAQLRQLERRSYNAYKAIRGTYRANGFSLVIDHVQGDPFAEPSRLRAVFDSDGAALPVWAYKTRLQCISTADFLNRRLCGAFGTAEWHQGDGSSGKSGRLELLQPGQQVLARSSVVVRGDGGVEVRFRVGLPARGRRILGQAAAGLLTDTVPRALAAGMTLPETAQEDLKAHLACVEDSQALRAQLSEAGLVAFVAEGSILPRASGVDDGPLSASAATAFEAPEALRVTLDTPNFGPICGMGVPAGITLIVGGGYHGKSTLLRAIERGIYDHIPGDGRERVVADNTAAKIRAEDGRRVCGVDIRNFIGDLPGGADTKNFCSENASGSTSQAAAIIEAIEVGARVLLLDEDTSATNFMIRDARMQRLVQAQDEPITPLIDRVQSLFSDEGISTVLVVGGAGDYFDVADTVIGMQSYIPYEATGAARAIADALPSARRSEAKPWAHRGRRIPLRGSVDASRGRKSVSIKAHREDRVLFGESEVELSAVEQISERAQTRAMAQALVWAGEHLVDEQRDICAIVKQCMSYIEESGLDGIQSRPLEPHGDFSCFRPIELAAFLNRLRTLRVRTKRDE